MRSLTRGSANTLGVVLLVAVTVVAAVGIGTATPTLDESPSQAALSLSVDGSTVTLVHESGDALDATTLRVVVSVDGAALIHQPPVPFFSTRGFEPGPTGPFNSAADETWTAGERAGFTVAGTNDPVPEAGDVVRVRVYVGDAQVADLEKTA